MRTLVLFLILAEVLIPAAWAASGSLSKIVTGMTKTDVLIELGRPLDAHAEGPSTYWTYPSTITEVCTIHFVRDKVASDAMKCDSSEKAKEVAGNSSEMIANMNSEAERQNRMDRSCGMRPNPRPGCVISMQCKNGEWEEVCGGAK